MVASRGNNSNPARIPGLGFRVLLLILVSILLMYFDHRDNHLDGIRRTVGAAVYPVRIVVDAPAGAKVCIIRKRFQSAQHLEILCPLWPECVIE